MIPLLKMQEHCEAYALWHLAVDRGWLPSTGNLLLHVDHHDDLGYGPYWHNFEEPVTNAQQARAFAEKALGIADFIVPSFWDGIFDEMINFTSIFESPEQVQKNVVFCAHPHQLNFRELIPLVDGEAIKNHDPRYRVVTCRKLSLCPIAPLDKPVVLDVDLDYFCWDHSLSTGVPARMEVTRAAYEEFCGNPLHPWRITARRMLFAEQEDGRYYIVLREPPLTKRDTRDELVLRRLDKFAAWLEQNGIRPAVIDVCRSSLSGYCPADRVEWIEEELLKRLTALYSPLDEQTW